MKNILACTIIMFLCMAAAVYAADEITAKAALVLDVEKGKAVFEKNINLCLPAASTVKIFTASIAAKQLDRNKEVLISKRAAGIAPSKAFLTEGASYKVDDLLKCFLMGSANDAGVALAEAVSGTEFKFSLLMNKRAQEIGARNSFFLNATGLPEYKKRQYSTARDLALFMKEFLKEPFLVGIIREKYATVSGSDAKQIKVRNHNKFLWRNEYNVIGKTGYTLKAKHCFLGTFVRGKKRYIVVMLGSANLWKDLEKLITM
ncbi:MAG: D-alanyl-D-alanine carboxypeptidase [Candidatus Omnitrophica bacterium]|nr:D-alanyl-D-alanine carboxypeptidase [Candidatus Omnitrophota bacterium]